MQEEEKNVFTVKFLSVFGDKIRGGEKYYVDDDTCDQRAPVNDPQELYNSFIVPEDVMDELENESVEDFENDVYDYEDRTDLGVDIAAAANLNFQHSLEKFNHSKKINKTLNAPEGVVEVSLEEGKPSEA